jgi:hypothetical protein
MSGAEHRERAIVIAYAPPTRSARSGHMQSLARFSLRSNGTAPPTPPGQVARRTIRKLTIWSGDEWRRVEDAARPSGVPPLRFVREAALEKAGKGAAPSRRRRRADELVHQLARVLNNLRQLHRVAEDDWDEDSARLIAAVIAAVEAATAAPPERGPDASAMLAEVRAAGAALNELAHRANAAEYVPAEGPEVLAAVYATVRRCLP